jgi:hypothetical protein
VTGGDVAIVYDGNGARLVADASEANTGPGAPVPDDDSSVAPIGGAVGETRTQYGGSGDGGGGSAPSIGSFDISDTSNSNHAKYGIDWSVSDPDGDLDSVTVFVNDTTSDSTETTYTGDSGSEGFQKNNAAGNDFEIKIVAVDSEGNEACEVVTDTADGSGNEDSSTC